MTQLDLIPTEDLVRELMRRATASVIILRQDEKVGQTDTPMISYHSEGSGVFDAIGMIEYARAALLDTARLGSGIELGLLEEGEAEGEDED